MSDQAVESTSPSSENDSPATPFVWVEQQDFARDPSGKCIPFYVRAFNALCHAIIESQRPHPSPLSLALLRNVRMEGTRGCYSINRADFVAILADRDNQVALIEQTGLGIRSIEIFCSYLGVDYLLSEPEPETPPSTLPIDYPDPDSIRFVEVCRKELARIGSRVRHLGDQTSAATATITGFSINTKGYRDVDHPGRPWIMVHFEADKPGKGYDMGHPWHWDRTVLVVF